jgi:hypothetical protein
MLWTTHTYSHFAVSRETIKRRALDDYVWIDRRLHLYDPRCRAANATFGKMCCSYEDSYMAASTMERSFSLIFGCASWLCEVPQTANSTKKCNCAECKSGRRALVPGEVSPYGCRAFHALGNFSREKEKRREEEIQDALEERKVDKENKEEETHLYGSSELRNSFVRSMVISFFIGCVCFSYSFLSEKITAEEVKTYSDNM